jgi:hypothetical protein
VIDLYSLTRSSHTDKNEITMLFGRSRKPDKEEKPKTRSGLDPKTKAHLYISSLMSCGTPQGTLTNAQSLQSLLQEHPDAKILTEEERVQIGQYLRNLGNETPAMAQRFLSLADFFGGPTGRSSTQEPETKVRPETNPPPPIEGAPISSTDSEGYGGSIAEAVSQFQDTAPNPSGDIVIDYGVEPGAEHRFAPSLPGSPPAPSPPEPTSQPTGQTVSTPLDSGAFQGVAYQGLGADLGYGDEALEALPQEDPLREAKERYYAMYADFANKVEECARSESLSENQRALNLGLKLEKVLQEKQVALPMEDAVKLRNAFATLRTTFAERNEAGLSLVALRLSATFGDEEAAKAYAEARGPKPDEPAGEPAPQIRSSPPPSTAPAGKGRPYDAPVDELTSLINKDPVGRADLERALGPASQLEDMIKEGAAVPLKALRDIAEKASLLGNRFSAEEKWVEAKLAYKLALVFSREKQAVYEHASARAEEARTRRLFADLARGDAPVKPSPPDSPPQKPGLGSTDEAKSGPKIIQGSAEAYGYLMQSGPGLEAPAQTAPDTGKDIKPKYTDKYLMDPMHAYAILAGKEAPSAETVIRIIELHKGTDQYTVDLAVKHPVVKTPELQARIEKILKI